MIDWLSIALWIIGAVGITGALVLFFVAPAVLEVLVTGAQKILGALLATRLGCALIAAAIAGIAADQYRARVALEQCRAVIEQRDRAAERAAQQRDKDQSRLADFDAQQRVTDLEKQFRQDQELIDALRQADTSCHPLTPDQLR